MKKISLKFLKTKLGKLIVTIAAVMLFGWLFMAFLYNPFFEWYTGVKNATLTYDSSKKITSG